MKDEGSDQKLIPGARPLELHDGRLERQEWAAIPARRAGEVTEFAAECDAIAKYKIQIAICKLSEKVGRRAP